jgi:hypothetical protein
MQLAELSRADGSTSRLDPPVTGLQRTLSSTVKVFHSTTIAKNHIWHDERRFTAVDDKQAMQKMKESNHLQRRLCTKQAMTNEDCNNNDDDDADDVSCFVLNIPTKNWRV